MGWYGVFGRSGRGPQNAPGAVQADPDGGLGDAEGLRCLGRAEAVHDDQVEDGSKRLGEGRMSLGQRPERPLGVDPLLQRGDVLVVEQPTAAEPLQCAALAGTAAGMARQDMPRDAVQPGDRDPRPGR